MRRARLNVVPKTWGPWYHQGADALEAMFPVSAVERVRNRAGCQDLAACMTPTVDKNLGRPDRLALSGRHRLSAADSLRRRQPVAYDQPCVEAAGQRLSPARSLPVRGRVSM